MSPDLQEKWHLLVERALGHDVEHTDEMKKLHTVIQHHDSFKETHVGAEDALDKAHRLADTGADDHTARKWLGHEDGTSVDDVPVETNVETAP